MGYRNCENIFIHLNIEFYHRLSLLQLHMWNILDVRTLMIMMMIVMMVWKYIIFIHMKSFLFCFVCEMREIRSADFCFLQPLHMQFVGMANSQWGRCVVHCSSYATTKYSNIRLVRIVFVSASDCGFSLTLKHPMLLSSPSPPNRLFTTSCCSKHIQTLLSTPFDCNFNARIFINYIYFRSNVIRRPFNVHTWNI